MNERMAVLREQLTSRWTQFSKKQKWMIAGIALFLLISLGLYIYIASQPVYTPLYNERLSEQEIGTIKQELESQKIPYRITGNGTGIEVPEKMAQDVIVDLAAQGIPSEAGINSEIFSNTLGVTDRQFDVMKKEALQQELRKMLERVKGVRAAQVMITLPQESVWVTETPETATASVIVDVEPGTTLDQKQINSLYLLVSRSVPKLPMDAIAITDQYSNPLERAEANENEGTLSGFKQQEQIKAEVEKTMQQNLYNLLGTIMGRDKVIVHTFIKMNFDKENRVENLVEAPDKENNEGLIISSQKLSKTFSGQGAPPGGVAGTGASAVPSYPASTPTGSNSDYEELNDTINREVNRITRNVTMSPYKIEDVTINVGVEPPAGGTLDDATIESIKQVLRNVVRVTLSNQGVELTQEELDKHISVLPRQFSGKVAVEDSNSLSPAVLWTVGGIAVLALAAVAFLVLRRRKQARQQEEEVPDLLSPSQPSEIPDLIYQEDGDQVVVRKQLEKLARSKPDEFVVLLRTWLAED
ncbi:flagellar basal-body MS-ring/collar protein FliF [Brevibacillus nitrificans]|uniref:flagellar basal-body MS-ring/collar protein FliF n=1 Tax=Brevibacillus nitrificans TaxID=651560 RepID=UPI002858F4D7|nr:flagellar basal-body MS-ring/collar protein FliF [Brevibacillus nitrificans]MDR7315953.1 flagellar M-ring protein FliF [Brevibacillus nitrificans]